MTRTSLVPNVVLLAAIQLCTVVHGEPDSKRQPLAFVNVNVVPMDREVVVPNQTVIVREGRIVSIGPASEANVPAFATRIDGSGKFLMPGLADMHVHLDSEDADTLALFLANGVTTVRNMWGEPVHLEWRTRIKDGDLLGPTIYSTGPITDGNPPYWTGSTILETAEEAEKEVMAQKQAGYDGVKVFTNLSPDVYEAILSAAKSLEFPVYGHVPTRLGLEKVLRGGQRSFEHMTDFMYALLPDDSPVRTALVDVWGDRSKRSLQGMLAGPYKHADRGKIPGLAAKAAAAGVWVCPTLVMHRKQAANSMEFEAFRRQPTMRYMPTEERTRWNAMANFLSSDQGDPAALKHGFDTMLRLVKALHDADGRLLIGTDTANPFVVPGFSIHEELQHFVEAGLTPYEAIKAGTRDAAEFLGPLDEWGTVTVGRRADLILVEANPLDDVANASKQIGVMLHGRWYPKAELQAKLDVLAEKYTRMKAEGAATVAIEKVNVVPMDREVVIPDQTVMVRDGRIVSIAPASEETVPTFATRIDGTGKYLMPGLADMHVHVWGDSDMPLFLANGVTSVRNMFGAPIHLAWRKQIEAGELLAPTIYTTSALIDGDPPIWEGSEVAATPEEARKIVAAQKAAGHRDLKVYSMLKSDVFAAIAEEAKANAMRFVGHVPDDVGLAGTLDAGMASIEHLTGYITALQADDAPPIKRSRYSFGVASRHVDEAKIPNVVQATREAGTWNCVTLVVMDKLATPLEERKKLLQSPEMRYVSPATRGMWDPSKSKRLAKLTDEDFAALRDGTAMLRKITRALHEGGARILLGTDCPNPLVVPGFSIHEELRNLVQAGVSPYEAIKAGTSDAAEFLGETGEFGVVRIGARADLILLEANPLDDVANVQKRVGVMVRGKWLPEEELHRMLEETAASFAPKKNPFEGLADLPKEGTRLRKGRYEMLVGDATFGYERIAVSRLDSGESVIHAQMILTAWSRAETRTRLAAGKSGLGESLRIEYEAATGRTTLECSRREGALVFRGTMMGDKIDRSEPIDREHLLGASSMAAICLLADRLRSLEIGDEIELSDKVVDLSPTLNFENRIRKLKRDADRANGRRVYSIEGKGKSVKGQFRGNLVVDPNGLPVEYRIEQAMGTFVFRLLKE